MIRDYQAGQALGGPYDVCILGAGPAGITLALRLAGAGWRVLLAEGGGRAWSERSQSLYQCSSSGLQMYPGETRLRFLGGTSNHWAGRCRPFDPSDFAAGPPVGLPGWPIGYGAIEPYLAEAMAIVDLPQGASFQAENADLDGGDFIADRFLLSPPTRFAQKYAQALEQTPGLDVLLDCNCVDLDFDTAAEGLAAVVLSDYQQRRQRVAARHFILAMGALENARQLLNSQSLRTAGVVRPDGMVGRCFMEHMNVELGTFILNSGQGPEPRQYYTSDAFVARNQAGKGNVSATVLAEVQAYGRTAEVKRFLENLTCDSGLASKVKFVANFSCPGDGVFSTMLEQFPNPDSRLTLHPEKDALGVAKANIHWALSEADRHSIQRIGSQLAQQFAAAGLGFVRLNDFVHDFSEPLKIQPHAHHMGTTRMAASAEHGVVDADCRVFGTHNLHVAGSSIFATGGAANPTMPLLQFALRLADHLNLQLKGS